MWVLAVGWSSRATQYINLLFSAGGTSCVSTLYIQWTVGHGKAHKRFSSCSTELHFPLYIQLDRPPDIHRCRWTVFGHGEQNLRTSVILWSGIVPPLIFFRFFSRWSIELGSIKPWYFLDDFVVYFPEWFQWSIEWVISSSMILQVFRCKPLNHVCSFWTFCLTHNCVNMSSVGYIKI